MPRPEYFSFIVGNRIHGICAETMPSIEGFDIYPPHFSPSENGGEKCNGPIETIYFGYGVVLDGGENMAYLGIPIASRCFVSTE
jgi:hypothetical protein